MSIDDAVERLTDTKDDINKWVGVYIGLLAVVLAICNVGGANAAKDAGRANLDAANTWAFFQAKNIRRTAITMAADELELQLAAQPSMPPAARQAFEAKIKDYRATVQKLTTDPEKKEGLDELFAKGKSLEAERDVAMRKDPYFDWSQALLQIAIVLASVHLIIGNLIAARPERRPGGARRSAHAQRLHAGPETAVPGIGAELSSRATHICSPRRLTLRAACTTAPAKLAMRPQQLAAALGTSMTTHSLLLLPGDGIGPEVMAEVERVVSFFNKKGKVEFKTSTGLVGGAAIDKFGVPLDGETLAKAEGSRRHRLRRRRRTQVGQGALREAPRGRPPAAAQGSRPVRQPAPRHLLSGAGGSLLAAAREGRGPRHPHPARADGRHLFRRAQGDRHAGGRPEARRRHHRLHHARDRAHRPRRLRSRPQAQATRCTRPRSATS